MQIFSAVFSLEEECESLTQALRRKGKCDYKRDEFPWRSILNYRCCLFLCFSGILRPSLNIHKIHITRDVEDDAQAIRKQLDQITALTTTTGQRANNFRNQLHTLEEEVLSLTHLVSAKEAGLMSVKTQTEKSRSKTNHVRERVVEDVEAAVMDMTVRLRRLAASARQPSVTAHKLSIYDAPNRSKQLKEHPAPLSITTPTPTSLSLSSTPSIPSPPSPSSSSLSPMAIITVLDRLRARERRLRAQSLTIGVSIRREAARRRKVEHERKVWIQKNSELDKVEKDLMVS